MPEANSYEQMVKEELVRRGEVTSTPNVPIFNSEVTGNTHSFKQKIILQESFENRKFLGFSYKKKVGNLVIPTGLCEVCNKLEVEHHVIN